MKTRIFESKWVFYFIVFIFFVVFFQSSSPNCPLWYRRLAEYRIRKTSLSIPWLLESDKSVSRVLRTTRCNFCRLFCCSSCWRLYLWTYFDKCCRCKPVYHFLPVIRSCIYRKKIQTKPADQHCLDDRIHLVTFSHFAFCRWEKWISLVFTWH